MKTPWLVASTTARACFHAQAAGFMFGISHNFGGDTGVTFKILSTERGNRPVLAAGVSFFLGEGRRHCRCVLVLLLLSQRLVVFQVVDDLTGQLRAQGGRTAGWLATTPGSQ